MAEEGLKGGYSDQYSQDEGKFSRVPGLLAALLEPGDQLEVMDWQFKRKKRKKRQWVGTD